MAADIEEQPSQSKLSGKKRKRQGKNQKLLIDERVEVRGIEEGFHGSWHSGTVIACKGKKRMIRYDHLLCDDHTGKLIETLILSPQIRPFPPPILFDKHTLHYGQCIDVFHKEAWWEGVIIDIEYGSSDRKIFFPDIGDEMTAPIDTLRITQDYDEVNHKWKPRGKWMFLELLAEIEEEWLVVISVKQIWYEVRGKVGFKNLNEWSCSVKDCWKELVFPVILENYKLSVRGIFVNLNPKQDKEEKVDSFLNSVEPILDRVVSDLGLGSVLPNVKCHTGQPIQESEFPNIKSQTSQPIQESEFKDDLGMLPNVKSQTSQPIQESEFKDDSIMVPNVQSHTSHPIQEIEFKEDLGMPPNVKSHTSHPIQEREFKEDLVTAPNVKTRTSQPIQESEFKEDLASLMEGGSFMSLLTSSTTAATVESQPQDLALFSPTNKNVSCQISSKIIKKRSSQINWHIAGPGLVPEPEYCPSAITEYNKKYTSTSKPSSIDLANVRKHLSFLGWKIEYWKDSKGKSKYRYYSPESKPKLYYSLHLLCNDLAESSSSVVPPPIPQDDHNNPRSKNTPRSKRLAIIEKQADDDSRDSPKGILSRSKSLAANEQRADDDSKDSSKGILSLISENAPTPGSPLSEEVEDEVAEPEYCPEAIVEYASLGGNLSRARKHDNKVTDLRLRVKKHLFFAGWSFFYIKKGTRRELRYQSPGGKVYISLMTACQSYIANDGKSNQKAHSSRRKRSSIRARKYVAPCHMPRTILCWLIDNKIIISGEKVFYGGKNVEGRVTRDGIACECCLRTFSLTEFQFHLGGKNRIPATNIFLEDGRSILECQRELKRVSSEVNDNLGSNSSDYICSVCHDGGDLILCDQCPSSFHISCLGLKDVPEGDWFCPLCCCGVCGKSGFDKDAEQFTDNTLLICHQCEHQYHVHCMRGKNHETLESYPEGNWFCNTRCEQIFKGLEGLLGKPVTVKGRLDNLTWTLLKNVEPGLNNDDEFTENYSKLNVALGVMHECFERVKEPRTDRDLVEDVLFNRWSDLRRLNFKGFYTVVLERNDELISAATVRVFGEKVAEVPLVGTSFRFRRLGMCRVLMDELEKKLTELGVERLVLPAIASVLDTWTGRFGFSIMKETERLGLLDYTFLYFQDTTMCQKFLSNSQLIAMEQQCTGDINGKEMMDLECTKQQCTEEFQALQNQESGNVEEKSVGPIDDTNNGSCSNHHIVTINQPINNIEYPSLQNELPLATSLKESQYDECEKDDHGLFQCYKRRKVSACGS